MHWFAALLAALWRPFRRRKRTRQLFPCVSDGDMRLRNSMDREEWSKFWRSAFARRQYENRRGL